MKLFNETEGARNGSPIVEIVVYALVILHTSVHFTLESRLIVF